MAAWVADRKKGIKNSSTNWVDPTSTVSTADGESAPQTLLAAVTDESAMPSVFNIPNEKKKVKKNADPKVGILLLAISP